MPHFGKTSKRRLETCHQDLQDLFDEVITVVDCSIIEGHRSQEKQDTYYYDGKSKVRWPYGKHNGDPSEAVDAAPYLNNAISWNKYHCIYLAGIVMGIASQMKIPIRWGGDWDGDKEPITDQDFQDLVHYELIL